MPRQFFTAADIKQLASLQKSDFLLLSPDDVVTQKAEDVAYTLGIRLVREGTEDKLIGEHSFLLSQASISGLLSPIKMVRGFGVVMEPFGKGLATPGANVRLKDVVTSADGSPMATGYMALEKGEFLWTLSYDEIDIVLEGELVITRGTEVVRGGPGDVIFIPKGSSITFGTPVKVRFVYVAFPANWNKQK